MSLTLENFSKILIKFLGKFLFKFSFKFENFWASKFCARHWFYRGRDFPMQLWTLRWWHSDDIRNTQQSYLKYWEPIDDLRWYYHLLHWHSQIKVRKLCIKRNRQKFAYKLRFWFVEKFWRCFSNQQFSKIWNNKTIETFHQAPLIGEGKYQSAQNDCHNGEVQHS